MRLPLYLFFSLSLGILEAQSSSTVITTAGLASVYSGDDGTVEYDWHAPLQGAVNSAGAIHISGKLNGNDAELDVPLSLETGNSSFVVQSVQAIAGTTSYSVVLTNGALAIVITVRQTLAGKTLVTDIQAKQSLLTALDFSLVPNTTHISQVAVPYYNGSVLYLLDSNLFVNGYFDWKNSNASQLATTRAQYSPMTNGHSNAPHERIVLSVSENLPEVLPTIGNPASRYMSQLAGRTVIDIWSQQNFSQVAETLGWLQDYGVNNCVVLVHGWQANGIDNALPSQFPASWTQGGDPVLSQAFSTAKGMNCFVGVHENYVDYYPNYFGFTTNSVARNSDGSLKLGWLNAATNVQSYATKPTWYVPNATTQSPQIHNGLGTNATFIDVNSASVPWFRTDMDSTQAGAGLLTTAANNNSNLWAFERRTHGGPVFGEGLNHWYWSGLIDGVEAQFGADGNASQAENEPLLVDFDLFKIHPLQVNHGMGMYDRWLTQGETIARTDLLDAYRMQELIYGHAPYIGDDYWSNIAQVLIEQNLLSPVAQRYGTQTVSSVSYQVNGLWTDSNAAAKAKNWSRVSVQYANGDTIVANGQSQALGVGGLLLPQYGWSARGTNLFAYTAYVSGSIGDYSQTATSYFANARNQADLAASSDLAQPAVQSVQPTGAHTFSINYQWRVLQSPSSNLSCFVHFVNIFTGATAFQGDHSFATPTSTWLPGQTVSDPQAQVVIPATVPDGIYSVRVGLYSPANGIRYQLLGSDDGSGRYILGNLVVSNYGQSLVFTPQPAQLLPLDYRLNGPGAILDFSTIRTDGMVSLQLTGGNWMLRAYPRYRDVTVQLNNTQFPVPSSITCDSIPVSAIASAVPGYWQVHPNGAKTCQWPSQ